MPSFGFGVEPVRSERFNPLTLATGAWASGPDEVVLDVEHGRPTTASPSGDTVRVAADGPVREFTVTGVARFGELNSMGGATIAVFDVPTARDGARQDRLRRDPGGGGAGRPRPTSWPGASRPLLPPAAELSTGDEQAASDKEVVSEGITFIRGTLLAFGGHRAVRGRLRDLQHPVDHGGPALARARHPAHARGLAAPGAALGDRRGRRSSAWRRRWSASGSASASPRA